ncbi:TIGR02594 family protein [Sphingomonas naphthae]|uniref:TIGR02594 family protein n=1 Tax=Sphingomonas naphthae TaxID=1813468 RepID=A0ABY7TP97_9SPHN|nr:TIGR02594 family protein [Sphingomonas naphthae]WCT75049.1 TIGR02594 family protein [Sphingomonas naphthae]
MEPLPAAYRWLNSHVPLPKIVTAALEQLGTVEVPGKANSSVIMGWADEVGVGAIGYRYTGDDVPWCGLFMAAMAKRAGKPIPAGPLYALNWAQFGDMVASRASLDTAKPLRAFNGRVPSLGDVLVFRRPTGGHVGLYVGEDANAFHVLGGNQGDRVCILRIAKARCVAVRRPPMSIPPASVRPFQLAAAGALSKDEA